VTIQDEANLVKLQITDHHNVSRQTAAGTQL